MHLLCIHLRAGTLQIGLVKQASTLSQTLFIPDDASTTFTDSTACFNIDSIFS